MKLCALLMLSVAASLTSNAHAANTLPLSNTWSIAPSGRATSSGELLFRVTPGDGSDVTEVTVSVLSGANETGVASNIRRALNLQLRADRFNVESGEGANILLSSQGAQDFSLELIDSDVENVRVVVQSAAPVPPPTVPRQATPANPPEPAAPQAPRPQAPGDATPPATAAPPGNSSLPPATPPPNGSTPSGTPEGATPAGGAPAGEGASAPPPPIATPGDAPAGTPPPTSN